MTTVVLIKGGRGHADPKAQDINRALSVDGGRTVANDSRAEYETIGRKRSGAGLGGRGFGFGVGCRTMRGGLEP